MSYKSKVLFVWQLGVNIIGLPELYKMVENRFTVNSRFFSPKNKIDHKLIKYEINK